MAEISAARQFSRGAPGGIAATLRSRQTNLSRFMRRMSLNSTDCRVRSVDNGRSLATFARRPDACLACNLRSESPSPDRRHSFGHGINVADRVAAATHAEHF